MKSASRRRREIFGTGVAWAACKVLNNFLEEVFLPVKPKALPIIAALALLTTTALLSATAVAVRAQNTTPAPPARAAAPPIAAQAPEPPVGFSTTTIFDDGNFLGIRTEEITRETAARYGVSGEPRGVGVREVIKSSPAERAGLREGDVIVRYDGEQVTSVRKLTRLIEESAPEHAARLTVLRGGSEQELSATLGRREPFLRAGTGGGGLTAIPFDAPDAMRLGDRFKDDPELWQLKGDEMREKLEELQRQHPGVFAIGSSRRIGVTTSPLGKQLADYFGVGHGVLVNSVEANSPADKAGLKAGDVLTEADGQQINEASDLVRAIGGKDEGEVTLTVVRERKQRTVRVKPERRQPQGLNLLPGAMSLGGGAPVVSVMPPVVAVTPPVVSVAPRVMTTPRAAVAPRVRVRPARITVLRPGDRIL
jgi:serine protease Do